VRCDRCGGLGFCWPREGHGAKVYPLPPELTVEPLDGWTEAEAADRDRILRLQEREQESCYPCPDCMPRTFHRWRGGHFDRHHDRANCDDEACQAAARHHR